MVIYIIDPRDPDWGRSNIMASTHDPKQGAIVRIAVTDSMEQIVEKIKREVTKKGQGKRSIWLMHIHGHGNIGYMEIGTGLHEWNAKDFKPLAEWMTPGGSGVVLHGCWVASAGKVGKNGKMISHNADIRPCELGRFYPGRPIDISRGWELLWQLSCALQVPVKAGIDVQYWDKYGEIEGPSLTVTSNGWVYDDVTWRKRGQKRNYP